MIIEKIHPNRYKATIKAPNIYIEAIGDTHTKALNNALLEYFRPF